MAKGQKKPDTFSGACCFFTSLPPKNEIFVAKSLSCGENKTEIDAKIYTGVCRN